MGIQTMHESDIWVNGGYFVFRNDIFRYLNPGEELVYEPFQRLIESGKLRCRRYPGFWQCMDTFKDKQTLDELDASGNAPWQLWKRSVSRAVVA
jgi:glucose-1-phosphate cytidylyltransferase